MSILLIFGILMLFAAAWVCPKLVRFTPKSYFSFLRFLTLMTIIRLIAFSLIKSPPSAEFVGQFNWYQFLTVFWEDMFFVFPLLYINKYLKSNILFYLFGLVASISFASGHIYQSHLWAAILLIYPTVMYYLGKKHGLGTVMVSHVTYDLVTYFTMLFAVGQMF